MARLETPAERTDRQVSWLISVGGVALVIGQAVPAASRDDDYALWWNVLGGLLLLLLMVFAAAGLVLPVRVLRVGWIVAPATSAFLLVTSFAVQQGPVTDTLPWVWAFEAAMVSYLVLLVRPGVAAALTVVSALLPALSAALFLGHIPANVATATPVHVANLIYIAIFAGIRTRLNRLRAAEARALDEEARRVRAAVEAEHHDQLARLVHDEVLSVLNAAMAFRGTPPAPLRAEASQALAMLEEPSAPTETHLIGTAEAAQILDQRLRRIDPGCQVRIETVSGQSPRVAVEVIGASAAEALRNSVRHANTAARQALIQVAPDIIEVEVRDSGPGFDPARIPDGALGLSESIQGRMNSLPGGSAAVETSPSTGTQVRLTWRT